MISKKANILFIFLILFSLLLVAAFYFREKFSITLDYLFYAVAVYVIYSIVLGFILKAEIAKKARQKDVQIIYKEKEVEPKKKIKKQVVKEDIPFKFFKEFPKFDSITKYSEEVLRRFAKEFDIAVGLFYSWNKEEQNFSIVNSFAYYSENTDKKFQIGEGINGQVAKNKKNLIIDNVPEGYIDVVSGLGKSNPRNLAFIPVISDNSTIGVIEIASFSKFSENADEIFSKIALKISNDLKKFID